MSMKCPTTSKGDPPLGQRSLSDFIVEYDKLKNVSEGFVDDQIAQEEENQDSFVNEPHYDHENDQSCNDETKSQMPIHVQMTVKVC